MAGRTSQHLFSQVPTAQIQRSSFNRDANFKSTLNAGLLIPFYWDEALPGDTHTVNVSGFCRLATPLHPIMDNLYFNTFFFAVPNRLLWGNWEKFNGEQAAPGDSTDFLVPIITAPVGGYAVGTIYDYFGLPTGIAGFSHSALPLRAYMAVYNEWFRDQNLQATTAAGIGDGPDVPTLYSLKRRGKRHDYFTSSLPWPQKGNSVTIPLGTSAPVIGIGKVTGVFQTGPISVRETTQQTRNYAYGYKIDDSTADGATYIEGLGASNTWPNIRADLSAATASTINQLRQAFSVQQLYERDARGGTRYTEILRSHFGVISDDARQQRPEYLGGGQSPVYLHTVPQTSNDSTEETPQGNLAAYGTSSMSGHGFTKSFTEHCIIIGLVCVRADLNYQQGMNRAWSRRARFDFYWPDLARLGEQAVLSKEIYLDGTAGDETVWGYQERFAEYRYRPSIITGQMRSTYAQSLDTWHLAQEYASRPLLNSTFIQEDPPVARVLAVPTEPHFIADFHFRQRSARPMPLYGVPGLTRF